MRRQQQLRNQRLSLVNLVTFDREAPCIELALKGRGVAPCAIEYDGPPAAAWSQRLIMSPHDAGHDGPPWFPCPACRQDTLKLLQPGVAVCADCTNFYRCDRGGGHICAGSFRQEITPGCFRWVRDDPRIPIIRTAICSAYYFGPATSRMISPVNLMFWPDRLRGWGLTVSDVQLLLRADNHIYVIMLNVYFGLRRAAHLPEHLGTASSTPGLDEFLTSSDGPIPEFHGDVNDPMLWVSRDEHMAAVRLLIHGSGLRGCARQCLKAHISIVNSMGLMAHCLRVILHFVDSGRRDLVETYAMHLPPQTHRVVELLLYMHRYGVQDARARVRALHETTTRRRNARVIMIAGHAMHEARPPPSPMEVVRRGALMSHSPTAPGVNNFSSPLSAEGMRNRYCCVSQVIATSEAQAVFTYPETVAGTLAQRLIRPGVPEVIPQPTLLPTDAPVDPAGWGAEWRLPPPPPTPPTSPPEAEHLPDDCLWLLWSALTGQEPPARARAWLAFVWAACRQPARLHNRQNAAEFWWNYVNWIAADEHAVRSSNVYAQWTPPRQEFVPPIAAGVGRIQLFSGAMQFDRWPVLMSDASLSPSPMRSHHVHITCSIPPDGIPTLWPRGRPAVASADEFVSNWVRRDGIPRDENIPARVNELLPSFDWDPLPIPAPVHPDVTADCQYHYCELWYALSPVLEQDYWIVVRPWAGVASTPTLTGQHLMGDARRELERHHAAAPRSSSMERN